MNRFFQVAPRYTGGSPAMVPERIARQVAAEEKSAREMWASGSLGNGPDVLAKLALGLRGIAEKVRETAKGWLVEDLITGEKFLRPFKAPCPKCKAKKVEVRKGKLDSHYWPGTFSQCDAAGTDVSKKLEDFIEV